jgi:hypothetical protein
MCIAYDSAMTTKKGLLAILGAGSSIPVGMPSVSDLDLCMKLWSEEWTSQIGHPNVFTSLWDLAMRTTAQPSTLRKCSAK